MYGGQPGGRQPGRSSFAGSFEPLGNELVQRLEQEHIREVVQVYQEQVVLREELKRVIDVMQNDMLPREKQLHDMLEHLNQSYLDATRKLHAHSSSFKDGASNHGTKLDSQRKQMLDPLKEAEMEVARIQNMLAQPLVISPDLPQDMVRQIHAAGASRTQQGPAYSSQPLSGPAYSSQPMSGPAYSSQPMSGYRPQPSSMQTPVSPRQLAGSTRQLQQSEFDRLDVNKDGVLTREEFARYNPRSPQASMAMNQQIL